MRRNKWKLKKVKQEERRIHREYLLLLAKKDNILRAQFSIVQVKKILPTTLFQIVDSYLSLLVDIVYGKIVGLDFLLNSQIRIDVSSFQLLLSAFEFEDHVQESEKYLFQSQNNFVEFVCFENEDKLFVQELKLENKDFVWRGKEKIIFANKQEITKYLVNEYEPPTEERKYVFYTKELLYNASMLKQSYATYCGEMKNSITLDVKSLHRYNPCYIINLKTKKRLQPFFFLQGVCEKTKCCLDMIDIEAEKYRKWFRFWICSFHNTYWEKLWNEKMIVFVYY